MSGGTIFWCLLAVDTNVAHLRTVDECDLQPTAAVYFPRDWCIVLKRDEQDREVVCSKYLRLPFVLKKIVQTMHMTM